MSTIVKQFNRWAKDTTRQPRTRNSIASKIKHLGLSTMDLSDRFSVDALADGLGVSPSKIRRLIKKGLLTPQIVSRQRHSVSRASAIKLILGNPKYFADCDPDRLFWILEKQELVDQVRNTAPTKPKDSRPVRCLTPTGTIVYPSIREAARRSFVCHSAIHHAINNGGMSAGFRWERCQ